MIIFRNILKRVILRYLILSMKVFLLRAYNTLMLYRICRFSTPILFIRYSKLARYEAMAVQKYRRINYCPPIH